MVYDRTLRRNLIDVADPTIGFGCCFCGLNSLVLRERGL